MSLAYLIYGFAAGMTLASPAERRQPAVCALVIGLTLLALGPTIEQSWAAEPPTAEPPTAEPATAEPATADEVRAEAPDVEAAAPTTASESAAAVGVENAVEGEVVEENAETLEAERSTDGTFEEQASRPIERVTNVRFVSRDGTEPKWLEMQPRWQGSTFLISAESKLHRTRGECEQALNEHLERAADVYVKELLAKPQAGDWIDYSGDELRARGVVVEQFDETIEVTAGSMHQTHALLAFDEEFAVDVRRRWSEVEATSRLLQTGIGSGSLLALLATVFGYFRVDSATRGYYTRRLQFATVGAILAVIASSVLAAQWIPWL